MVLHQTEASGKAPLTYLALGDSYTVGESVTASASFPFQLQQALRERGVPVKTPKVIARTGWTTGELLAALQQADPKPGYDLVTLLIGVNNQYRGYPPDLYEREFTELLTKAIAYAGGKKDRVFVLSIPDWSVTPFAAASGRDIKKTGEEINAYNHMSAVICERTGVSYTDITPVSRKAAANKDLTAADGLHPSGKMYGFWTAALLPAVRAALNF
ncbi:lysophospholipase [Pedobacter yulinensis]|uniref:Lysophospholipase n=1 Tax=Pedobacter yulinensis TaxID=2126353 RepID=A0A2T3HS17_9SPHI|nr:SGNH/GDSL hydrolase family protein [Pedobacter yulinensis]PST85260.1 lysophospholipase [Pedobacter yulinensis]